MEKGEGSSVSLLPGKTQAPSPAGPSLHLSNCGPRQLPAFFWPQCSYLESGSNGTHSVGSRKSKCDNVCESMFFPRETRVVGKCHFMESLKGILVSKRISLK